MERQKIGKLKARFSVDMPEESGLRSSQSQNPSATEFAQKKPNLQVEEVSFNCDAIMTPVLTNMQSSLITQRRHRKKEIPKQLLPKQEFTEYTRKRMHQRTQMKKVVRITDMLKLFFDKVTCNSPLRTPIEYDPFENELSLQKHSFVCQIQKVHFPKFLQTFLMVARILYIIIYFFAFPLSLLFKEVSFSIPMLTLKVFGLALAFFDFMETLQSNTTKEQLSFLSTAQLLSLGQLRKQALMMQTMVVVCTTASIILISDNVSIGSYLFLGMALNIKRYFQQNQHFQQQFFTATHYQKYWDLVKVLGMNLLVCHILACILISITYFQPQNSWMSANNIDRVVWYEQYIWSYYFGTTIILTIGFGDLHPANCVQSFFIIVISFFACVFFGYNINYIGNLINSIRQQQVQKNSKLKILSSLAKKAHVSKSIHSQISNYIIQESKIKQESNYTQEKHLLQELPDSLRSSFLQEANQKLFNHLKKMVPFTNRTVQRLSLAIQAKICHPDQTIKRLTNGPSLIILQSGQVGLVARIKNSRLNNLIIQRIISSFNDQSKIICADLLSGISLNYDIKSLAYSIIYQMSRQDFQQCINHVRQDYQLYRQILDRCKYKMNEFALVRCRFCQNKMHTLFQCPRLHFQPFRRTLPLKHCNKKNSQKQRRMKFLRNKKPMDFQFALQGRFSQDINQSVLSLGESLKNINSNLLYKSQARQNKAPPAHIIKNSNFRDSYQLTMQMITQLRQDIINLKRESASTKFEFTLWQNVDCDQACSFKYYFPKFNANILGEKVIKNTLMNWTRSIKKKGKKIVEAL